MKLGVSYNVFDGEELLEGSIKQIRPEVDYISVVYQIVSNYGQKCSDELETLLLRLKNEGLVDELMLYSPSIERGGHYNEIMKRNMGLVLSKKNSCTHHMSMDTDEYYITEEFKRLKEDIILNDYDSTYCQMKTYYKTWEYQLNPPEDYYVSLINKIKDNVSYIFGGNSPVIVDPTRRMNPVGKYKIYERTEIEMHHGSYIRNNLEIKLRNSNIPPTMKEFTEKVLNHYNKWEYPKNILWMGMPPKYLKVKQVKNIF